MIQLFNLKNNELNIVKVLKTFDIFNSEAFRFLKDKALNIFLIETPNIMDNGVNLATDKNSVNINIINRPKTYNLLISAKKRLEEKRAKEAAKL